MKRILLNASRRHGFDGWAVAIKGGSIIEATFSTTRLEVRELRKQMPQDLFLRTEIVKAKIKLEKV